MVKKKFNLYNASSIKVLKGLDAVRKRPGMYIGDTNDGTGLHHMVFELIDNSIDESLSGFCNKIIINLYKDNSVSIFDNGRGIPVDIHKEEGVSAAELIMTVLHSGGKFDNDSYKYSGGLHGVGVSVVNALSEKLELKIYRNNKEYYQLYNFGIPENKLIVLNNSNYTGTYIRFWPDKNIFTNKIFFNKNILIKRMNELSFLNPGLKLYIYDERDNDKVKLVNYGGLKDFLFFLHKGKNIIHNNIFYFLNKKYDFYIEIICQWIDVFSDNILCFTNNIPQVYGGSHLSGFKSAITRTVNLYIDQEVKNKKRNLNFIGEDIREGLFAIISIKMPNPKFSSQTKDKLISAEVRSVIESCVSENLYDFLLEHPVDAKLIINKIIHSFKAREYARKIREISKKKSNLDISIISGKLADCQEKNPVNSEIFLVEGDSAGGSAKQGRNRRNQAVLPLKGKIINVEKTTLDKVLSSREIGALITALGCGIGNDSFNLDKLKYHTVIIMTDADIDGAHIRTLLLTFFYKYMPDLIINGHLYVARPPLYRIKKGNKEVYVLENKDLIKNKFSFSFEGINLYKENNVLLMDSKKLIKLSLKYMYFSKVIFNDDKFLSCFLLKSLMYFRKLIIDDIYSYSLWLNDFLIYLNNNILNYKFYGFILNEYSVFDGFNIFYENKVSKNNFFIKKNFFIKYYSSVISLGKRLFFFNESYIKYIYLNNKKYCFDNFYCLIDFVLLKNKDLILIQRYKGLGEMNPSQLWLTTMDPKNRFISKIFIEDVVEANNLFKVLMGDNVELRKSFIVNNVISFLDMDI